ncbi:unnamed protein product [Cylicostephanus goldi]|uniref:MADF domain-containing protein n=1 Tax=Cylicostephanus goldi TaxID=71465 RepID=A0A3P6RUV6_CYLGO|nr:unnamed protein product [Cylicostephanus goldi]
MTEFNLSKVKRARPESIIRLNDTEKHYLVEVVERHPSLWYDRDPNFKSYTARASEWRSVSEDMETEFGYPFEVDALQKIFKNLRDVYIRKRREFQDVLRKSSGSESGALEKITSWPFYRELAFLESSTDQGERYTNIDVEELENVVDANENATEQVRVEQLTTMLKAGFEAPDKYESIAQSLAAELREFHLYDPRGAEEFTLRIHQIQLELSRSLLNAKKISRINTHGILIRALVSRSKHGVLSVKDKVFMERPHTCTSCSRASIMTSVLCSFFPWNANQQGQLIRPMPSSEMLQLDC